MELHRTADYIAEHYYPNQNLRTARSVISRLCNGRKRLNSKGEKYQEPGQLEEGEHFVRVSRIIIFTEAGEEFFKER